MSQLIFCHHEDQIRKKLTWDKRWKGHDKGLITCWEVGRELAQKKPELAERARNNELPILGWKGGVNKKVSTKKYGSLNYLAQWQGLRGDDLNIDISQEYKLICSKTNMLVIYTNETKKLFK